MDASFLIGLAGTLLSAAGFLFTFMQLRKTTTATEAASAAINSLRDRITTFDYATECAKARKCLEHSIGLCKIKQWPDAVGSLSEAQISLHRISVSNQCSVNSKESFSQIAKQYIEIISNIEDLSSKGQEIDDREILKNTRETINLLDTEMNIKSQEL